MINNASIYSNPIVPPRIYCVKLLNLKQELSAYTDSSMSGDAYDRSGGSLSGCFPRCKYLFVRSTVRRERSFSKSR